jgi:hypothetical protein
MSALDEAQSGKWASWKEGRLQGKISIFEFRAFCSRVLSILFSDHTLASVTEHVGCDGSVGSLSSFGSWSLNPTEI